MIRFLHCPQCRELMTVHFTPSTFICFRCQSAWDIDVDPAVSFKKHGPLTVAEENYDNPTKNRVAMGLDLLDGRKPVDAGDVEKGGAK